MTKHLGIIYKKLLLLFIILTIVGCEGPYSLASSVATDTPAKPINAPIEKIPLTQDERAFLDGLGELQVLVDDNFPSSCG